MVKKVSLFIVGQPKSGTTALASQLSHNTDICMASLKEPNFFADDLIEESREFHGEKSPEFLIRNMSDYVELFKHASNRKVWAEASTAYLYSKKAARNIYAYNKDAVIVMILREPVSLMHSLHMQYVNEANEPEREFSNALAKESERKLGKHVPKRSRCPSYLYYSERAKYAEQVKRYFEYFPPDQILLYSFDEYKKDNKKIYEEICGHIGASTTVMPSFRPVHESKSPRSHTVNALLRQPMVRRTAHKALGTSRYTKLQKKVEALIFRKQARTALNSQLEEKLRKDLRPEVAALSTLTGRDFLAEWGY